MTTHEDTQRTMNSADSLPVMSDLTVRDLEMLPKMDEISKITTIPVEGSTNIYDEVIGAVAGFAAKEVEGVADVGTSSIGRVLSERLSGANRRARGVTVEAGQREAILDLTIRVYYGVSIPHVVTNLRQNVADKVLKICGLIAKEINVRVAALEFSDSVPGRVR